MVGKGKATEARAVGSTGVDFKGTWIPVKKIPGCPRPVQCRMSNLPDGI